MPKRAIIEALILEDEVDPRIRTEQILQLTEEGRKAAREIRDQGFDIQIEGLGDITDVRIIFPPK